MGFIQAKIKSKIGKIAMAVIPQPIPKTYTGESCISELGALCNSANLKNVLIVTDEVLPTLGLLDSTYQTLEAANVKYHLFDKVTPDPAVETCVDGCKMYVDNQCDGIVAFGGGSSMDCAKFIAVLTTDTSRAPKSFAGTMSIGIFTKLPMIIAIPTTAGTGSETTLAAVISFPKEKRKYTVLDPKLVPPYAFLDPLLTKKLPASITAATGMDALTHAIESFVSPWRTEFTTEKSLSAIKNIFHHLPDCFANGDNLEAREKMLVASFDAGVAFTRAGVGYVHAIAHQLGALFHIPHGVANAMLLHKVLEFYLTPPTNDFAVASLARMALVIKGRGNEAIQADERDQLAREFVDAVEALTRKVEIPEFAKGFPAGMVNDVAQRAINEAHGQQFNFFEDPIKNLMDAGYPVPKYMTLEECEEIAAKVVDPTAQNQSKL